MKASIYVVSGATTAPWSKIAGLIPAGTDFLSGIDILLRRSFRKLDNAGWPLV